MGDDDPPPQEKQQLLQVGSVIAITAAVAVLALTAGREPLEDAIYAESIRSGTDFSAGA